MESWRSRTGTTLSNKKLLLRRAKASFRLYRQLIFISFFLLATVILVSLSSVQSPIIHKTRSLILSITTPVIQIVSMPFDLAKGMKNYMISWTDARRQSLALAEENKNLKAIIDSMENIKDENNELRKFLNVRATLPSSPITAKVLSYPGRPFIKSILINVGEEEGIHLQQVAIDDKGLIGRVITVGKSSAHILLLTDINSHVPIVVKDTETQGILSGSKNGLPLLRYVQAKLVHVGDVVETSGHGGIFPSHIPVGKISKIEGENIFVELFSDLENLSFVMLLEPLGQQ